MYMYVEKLVSVGCTILEEQTPTNGALRHGIGKHVCLIA